MTRRTRLTIKQRQALYDRELSKARAAGKEHPDCNICDLPVLPGDLWDESHWPRPRSFGGTITGIAHRYRCNRRHGAKIVTPLLVKSNRTRARHTGAFFTRHPLPGGRDDRLKRTMRGQIVLRATGEPWRPGR